jgi:hypothetical protein
MELRNALAQIDEIRQSLARAQVFRGYRSLTTAITGILALLTATVHGLWEPTHVETAVALWVGAAVLSLVVVGTEMAIRCIRSRSEMQKQMTLAAGEQFVPCVVAGALLTYVLLRFAPQTVWMLPGLWAMLLAMGVLASRPVLPRGVTLVGAYYLLAGLLCLATGSHAPSFSPIEMGVVFGLGQFFAAAVLWWSLERNHVSREE